MGMGLFLWPQDTELGVMEAAAQEIQFGGQDVLSDFEGRQVMKQDTQRICRITIPGNFQVQIGQTFDWDDLVRGDPALSKNLNQISL